MIDKLKSLPVETSEQLIRTFISVIDSSDVIGSSKWIIKIINIGIAHH
ncbi:hypothetical protein [uncultured Eubacterium sp.]|nr:hypothetical protein [uncultured Eubacterium sp.]